MTRWQMEPLSEWRWSETKVRKSNPFRSTIEQTMAKLTEEAERLKIDGTLAIHVVTDTPNDVRRDGLLRARAQVRHPGVAVSFMSKLGALTYPCDAFVNRYYGLADWQVNLRAIALGLEALRTLDRYGMTGQQYVGYLAIESGGDQRDDLSTPQGAERFLRSLVDAQWRTAPLRVVWRQACLRAHPDTTEGEASLWNAVRQAGDRLNLTSGKVRT